jgi:4-hydroxyphenylpyruvate dioxygenase-like putative hemolysin
VSIGCKLNFCPVATIHRAKQNLLGESREVKFLSAHGREVKAGLGVLLLLESSEKDGLLSRYLSDHDEGIIGVSIQVADLGKARQLAESGTGRKLETHKGFYGTSFHLPPEVTHGVWLEMFQPIDLLH